MEKQQFRLGLVGYGEIGSTVGAGLEGRTRNNCLL